MISRARRLMIPLTGVLLATGVIGATTATGANAGAAAPGDVVSRAASASVEEAIEFWSPAKMRAAKDATDELDVNVRGTGSSHKAVPDGPAGTVPPIGAEKAKPISTKQVNLPNTVGRVFFTLPGKSPTDPASWKYCSGSSVQGKYRNVVATSAHCVYDVKRNTFYDNWIFIPSYWDGDQIWDGKTPYGIYAAKWFNAHDDFVVKEDYDYDYAFVNVHGGVKIKWKQVNGKWVPDDVTKAGRLGDNVGGQGFTWNRSTKATVFSFGYPAGRHPDGDKPYTGRTMKWCYGTTAPMPAGPAYRIQEHVGFKCAFTAGASGGPLLYSYKNSSRTGYLIGVNSVAWDTDGNDRYDRISSPYFNSDTYDVYKKAANRWTE
ncbi:peptidase [Microtetraspora sp. NBRC 13810]|uniref:trypsin-like serine peptidase n=1 Tax=Microtetraspora sp. NBRC 13810 TaxID=3030990 RepID=UPI0024A5E82B|nr:serine protease [Microtetraspora sp. NBRC 13810]GLW06273.1 peptidase [Microtetraspora sp. NBRC 13810]